MKTEANYVFIYGQIIFFHPYTTYILDLLLPNYDEHKTKKKIKLFINIF